MIYKPAFLPSYVHWHAVQDSNQLADEVSSHLTKILSRSLLNQSRVSLAVSGGRSPIATFERLSVSQIQWANIDITLVDERWVDKNHEDSSEGLVRRYLLKNATEKAKFIGLKNESLTAKDGQVDCYLALQQLVQPFEVVLLGMGLDGHTASLFPDCPELTMAMDSAQSLRCLATTPKSANHERMTFSYNTIMEARHRVLHLKGTSKLAILEEAMSLGDPMAMPICAFLQHPITLFWSPS